MSIQQSAYYPLPVVAGTTAGTYAEGNAPRIIDVTHAELLSLMGANNLKRGFHYRITDFVTEYMSNDNEWISPSNTANVSNNNGTAFTVASIAATPEPLIVYAYSSSNVSREAYSELHPRDIIHYDPQQTFLDGTNTAKGFIIYRKDTFNDIECDYDWRNVRFKRWALDPEAGTRPIPRWQPSTNYNVGDLVLGQVGTQTQNFINICSKDHISESSQDGTKFIQLSNFQELNGILLHEAGLFEFGARKTINSFDLFGGAGQAGYYHTTSNRNGTINTTNRFKNISIKSLKPQQQNPNFSSTLPNVVMTISNSGASYFRNIKIDASSAITMFGLSTKFSISIKNSQYIYISDGVQKTNFNDCLFCVLAGVSNNETTFTDCVRSCFASCDGFNLSKAERVSVVPNQNNTRSTNCHNVVIYGKGAHISIYRQPTAPIVTDFQFRAAPVGFAPEADVIYTTGANNLPVAQYVNQNNQVEAVPLYEDSELLFKHINSQILSQIDGVEDPSASLPLFSSINHTTPSYTRNTSSWLDSLKNQLTCVSVWNSEYSNQRAGVAITKRHIQFARHFPLKVGSTIRFVTADNQVVNRTIVKTFPQPITDISANASNDTFTKNSHGLLNGDKISFVNLGLDGSGLILDDYNSLTYGVSTVVNATENTFQVSSPPVVNFSQNYSSIIAVRASERANFENDICIGLLDEDLPESIVPAKIFLGTYNKYFPESSIQSDFKYWLPSSGVFFINQNKNAAIVDITAYGRWLTSLPQASGQSFLTRPLENNKFYDQSVDGNKYEFYEQIVGGDSGGPVFAIINGECVLFGCIWQGSSMNDEGRRIGIAFGEPPLENFLNSKIAAIDAAEGISTGYTVTAPDLSGFAEVS